MSKKGDRSTYSSTVDIVAGDFQKPAAMYIRMSTEHQQYSITNQADAIYRYAERNGFVIVKTYADAGKSGVVLQRREGLKSLLQDVVSGDAEYQAILVYDVSRWGRFQNTDEAAHYEFICTRAGIPVHYTAEQFANDGSTPSLIMKAVRRTMAGEFSRDLGEKVYQGQEKLVSFGFKMGGRIGPGLRRLLLSKDGKRRFFLKPGQQKNLSTDRVILVRGPEKEVRLVQTIFRMALTRSTGRIIKYLNERGIRYIDGAPWNENRVNGILRNPNYTGQYVWGKVSVRLHTPKQRHPTSEWRFGPKTFRPIISREIFDKVQEARRSRYTKEIRIPDEELLNRVRSIVQKDGAITRESLRNVGLSYTRLYSSFKNLSNLYRLVGHKMTPKIARGLTTRVHHQTIRDSVLDELRKLFPEQVQVCKLGSRYPPVVVVNQTSAFIVRIGAKVKIGSTDCWKFPDTSRRKFASVMALACMLDNSNSVVEHYFLLHQAKELTERVRLETEVLRRGIRLNKLSDLLVALERFQNNRHYASSILKTWRKTA